MRDEVEVPKQLPIPSVSTAEEDGAKFAVCGNWNGGHGVISWHASEFHAHINAKFVNNSGGTAEVHSFQSVDDYCSGIYSTVIE